MWMREIHFLHSIQPNNLSFLRVDVSAWHSHVRLSCSLAKNRRYFLWGMLSGRDVEGRDVHGFLFITMFSRAVMWWELEYKLNLTLLLSFSKVSNEWAIVGMSGMMIMILNNWQYNIQCSSFRKKVNQHLPENAWHSGKKICNPLRGFLVDTALPL